MGTQYYHPQAISKVAAEGGNLEGMSTGSCHAELDVARHYEKHGLSPEWGDYIDYVNVEGKPCRWSPLVAILGGSSKWLPTTSGLMLPLKMEFERLTQNLGGVQAAAAYLRKRLEISQPDA